MRHVDQERLERWLIRKTQKLKDKQKNRKVSTESKQIGKKIWFSFSVEINRFYLNICTDRLFTLIYTCNTILTERFNQFQFIYFISLELQTF
mgnify:CR=1 FL=1